MDAVRFLLGEYFIIQAECTLVLIIYPSSIKYFIGLAQTAVCIVTYSYLLT